MKLSAGYILAILENIVIIATGIAGKKSANRKTGQMIQIWILRSDMSPVDAVKTGADSAICGTCPHRGDRSTGRKRSCYVNVGQAPDAVYRAFRRGSYPTLALADYPQVFKGRAVRLGAYGDPAMIPPVLIEAICSLASKHTGYTHQWTRAEWLKPFVMASCDSPADFVQASHHGWRTFRVAASLAPLPSEILCPSSNEAGNRTTCAKCGLCNGAGSAKNIFIPVHGSGKKNALVILQ
jgi:hypothetical protein